MTVRKVAVIGAGPMGRRMAALICAAGFDTVLEDVLPSNLRKAAEELAGDSAVPSQCGNLRFATTVEEAARSADLIVDCVPDELESKLEIFSLLDRMAPPRAIFVTPTVVLSIADLASCTYRADRCIAVRFASKGPLPGELLPGEGVVLVSMTTTSPEALEEVARFWTALGFATELHLDPAESNLATGTPF